MLGRGHQVKVSWIFKVAMDQIHLSNLLRLLVPFHNREGILEHYRRGVPEIVQLDTNAVTAVYMGHLQDTISKTTAHIELGVVLL
jgi:hypothetical protein